MPRKKKLDIVTPPMEMETDNRPFAERQQERLANLKQNLQEAMLNPSENELYIEDLKLSIEAIGG